MIGVQVGEVTLLHSEWAGARGMSNARNRTRHTTHMLRDVPFGINETRRWRGRVRITRVRIWEQRESLLVVVWLVMVVQVLLLVLLLLEMVLYRGAVMIVVLCLCVIDVLRSIELCL